jgi:hypothetical protein
MSLLSNGRKMITENIFYNPDRIDNNPLLINDLQYHRVFLMTKTGKVLHEWPLGDKKL